MGKLTKVYSKKAMKAVVQRAIDLERAADKAALSGKWDAVARMNAEIETIAEQISMWGFTYATVIENALGSGMKARPVGPVKGVSSSTVSDTPWYDDDSYLDTASAKSPSTYKPAGGSYKAPQPKCAHSHPLLTIPDGKSSLTIQGGSCYSPQGDYDVEIMLCSGASLPNKLLPWDKTQFVRYPIVDMQAPADKEEFDKVIDWTVEQIRAGRKVHVGCIGGHGRTGTFLSALVNRITGQKDSTAWLRANYCKKAVESATQIDWLFKHYGIEKVEPSKSRVPYTSEAKTPHDKKALSQLAFGNGSSKGFGSSPKTYTGSYVAAPLPGKSVWGKTVLA
jgi:protein-tyrosine phosphatase